MAATYLIAILYAPYILSYCVRCLGRCAQPQRDFQSRLSVEGAQRRRRLGRRKQKPYGKQ